MEKGIIYLLQPSEYVGTSIYKIGYSGKTSLDRCHTGYKKGSRYLCINECINPIILENKIKKDFNNKFKLVVGREYFEGDEENIKLSFRKLVEEHEIEYPNVKEVTENINNKVLNIPKIKKENIIIKEKIKEELSNKVVIEPEIQIKQNKQQDIKIKQSETNLECNYCNNIYKSNSARILHYNQKHNEEYELDKIENSKIKKKYKCLICNNLFASRQAKHYHIKKCIVEKKDDTNIYLKKTDIKELNDELLKLKNSLVLLTKVISNVENINITI